MVADRREGWVTFEMRVVVVVVLVSCGIGFGGLTTSLKDGRSSGSGGDWGVGECRTATFSCGPLLAAEPLTF